MGSVSGVMMTAFDNSVIHPLRWRTTELFGGQWKPGRENLDAQRDAHFKWWLQIASTGKQKKATKLKEWRWNWCEPVQAAVISSEGNSRKRWNNLSSPISFSLVPTRAVLRRSATHLSHVWVASYTQNAGVWSTNYNNLCELKKQNKRSLLMVPALVLSSGPLTFQLNSLNVEFI